MSVEIKGIDFLDRNNYDKMIIAVKRNNYIVEVIGIEKEYKTIDRDNRWSNILDSKSDEEKIEELINYYLDYSNINEINQYEFIPCYDGLFYGIKGTRQLYMNLNNVKFKDIYSRIQTKYINNRMVFLEKNKDIKNYSIGISRGTSYKKEQYNYLPDSITIKLQGCINQRNGIKDIVQEEKQFLQEFLYDKFSEQESFAHIEDRNLHSEDCENYVNLGYHVTCGDLSIGIDNVELLPDVVHVVEKYNKERKDAKIKQLKLEGF